jgi:formylglycine-generating enzyme required for sulfatase activity/predicted Ser/Thr protein kinase
VESGNKCPKCGTSLSQEGGASICPKCAASLILGRTVQYFGDYELLEEIGRGGMGVVYQARQSSLNRSVALKMMIQGGFASPEFVRRFQNEAESAASLQHPNIVAIYEVGEIEGLHYFSMDYIDGPSLAEVVREGPLPAERAARYVELVAEAIHHAHQRGILHRDLKPSNVLIDPFDQPRVTDFGLAKRLDHDLGPTFTGQVLGSPGYMPPEQAAGRHSLIGVPSDVYALGAILYHLLTGQAPFAGENEAQVLVRVQKEDPTLPRTLNPGVPRDLETICLKCLCKQPADRYASAAELAADLRHWQKGEKIAARPQRVGGKLLSWCGEYPRAVFSAGLVLLAIAALGFGSWWVISRAPRSAAGSPAPTPPVVSPPPRLQPGQRWTNSLGMIFVPVAGTAAQFSIWDTRVQDYQAFVAATGRLLGKPKFEQGPTHPAVMVSWDDAKAFCAWLTEEERRAGTLNAAQEYRLPTDLEWSAAVGLENESGSTPQERNRKIVNVFPWGTQWPRPRDSGNYAGQGLDNFTNTSPVGSFAPNRFGLYDMGGNVPQWCEDFYDGQSGNRVLRGAGWNTRNREDALLSSARSRGRPGFRRSGAGFRCVLATGGVSAPQAQSGAASTAAGSPAATPAVVAPPPGLQPDQRQTNSLDRGAVQPKAAAALEKGPDFEHENPYSITPAKKNEGTLNPHAANPNAARWAWIPPGTFMMGSPANEARRGGDETQHRVTLTRGFYMSKYLVTQGDYLALMANNPSGHLGNPNFPVEKVTWNDATNYCGVLTRRERAAGRLPVGWLYRLPTEAEWEYAGRAGTTTAFYFGNKIKGGMANFKSPYEYDASIGVITNSSLVWRGGTTTPVGNYPANPWGLYDMCGNVWEWCQDWYSRGGYPTGSVTNPVGPVRGSRRVRRGGAYDAVGGRVRSAARLNNIPTFFHRALGFRPVLAREQE